MNPKFINMVRAAIDSGEDMRLAAQRISAEHQELYLENCDGPKFSHGDRMKRFTAAWETISEQITKPLICSLLDLSQKTQELGELLVPALEALKPTDYRQAREMNGFLQALQKAQNDFAQEKAMTDIKECLELFDACGEEITKRFEELFPARDEA